MRKFDKSDIRLRKMERINNTKMSKVKIVQLKAKLMRKLLLNLEQHQWLKCLVKT